MARNVYRLAHQCQGAREWQRYLQSVPAWKLYEMSRDYMKRQYGLARVTGKRDCAGLGHKSRAARPINRERRVHSARQTLGHISKRTASAASSRPARSAIPESLDEAPCVFGVPALARHHHYTALAPEPRSAEYAHMPEGEYGAATIRQNGIEMMAAPNFPSQRRADDANQQVKEYVCCADYNAVAQAESGKV
jgi:hypothetical protein